MIFPVFAVLLSCTGCMSLVELLAKYESGCMNLMTFATFLFISVEGYFIGTKRLSIPNRIPLRAYLKLVVVFFLVSTVNNAALAFRIPVPLHIIFRSGSLLASMLLGMIILRKRYSVQKYLSVLLVTVGIIICTFASAGQITKKEHEDKTKALHEWLIGIAMLVFALIASAYLGITQERLYAQYGKHPREALFYVHVLSLPGFLLLYKDIWHHVLLFNQSAPIAVVPLVDLEIPKLWFLLLMVCCAQFACIRTVYVLTSEFSALSVTLVVTLRKFISLLLSVWYFQNPFRLPHWIGAFLVFCGTLMFGDVIGQIRKVAETYSSSKEKQKTQ